MSVAVCVCVCVCVYLCDENILSYLFPVHACVCEGVKRFMYMCVSLKVRESERERERARERRSMTYIWQSSSYEHETA